MQLEIISARFGAFVLKIERNRRVQRRHTRWFFAAGVVLVFGSFAIVITKYGSDFARAMHHGVVDQKLSEAWADLAQKIKSERNQRVELEDSGARKALPEFKTLKALSLGSMTRHIADEPDPKWVRSGGNNASSKYSGANLITTSNVKDLKVAWEYSTPESSANIQANPIYTGTAIVFPDARDVLVALNPSTGAKIWEFDPHIPRPAMRGLTYLRSSGGRPGVVYFTAQGRLFALNAESGKLDSRFAGGSVAIGYVSKVAPAVWNNFIVVSSTAPALHAYELGSGRNAWTIPLRPADTADSSIGYGGGVNWGGFSIDDIRGLAFVTTSNPSPVGYGGRRQGRNPGTSAIIAVDLVNRRIAWEFQEVGHDLWDLDISAAPVLASLKREGETYDVVVAATKAGNVIVLDRRSGQPVFDFRLRRAPASEVPGEKTQAYQPDPELPDPVGTFEFALTDVTDIGPRNRQSVLDQLHGARFGFFEPHVPGKKTVFFGLHGGVTQFGPAFDPSTQTLIVAANREPSSFSIVDKNSASESIEWHNGASAIYERHCSSCHGARLEGGQGPSLRDIDKALSKNEVYAIVRRGIRTMPALVNITDAELATLTDGLFSLGGAEEDVRSTVPASGDFVRTAYTKLKDFEGYPGSKPPWGTLQAIDLNTGRTRWKVPLGHFEELLARGLPATGTPNFGGPIITATGLAFVSGTKDKLVRAFNSATGEQLWSHALPNIGSASPMTYIYEGRQYVLQPATGGGTLAIYDSGVTTGSSFIAFALGKP